VQCWQIAGATWSTVAAPIQYAAVTAYRPTAEIIQYIKDCTAIHEIITMSVYRRLAAHDIRCPSPEGAFYLFPEAPTADDLSFVQALLAEGILAVPGSGFGTPGYFRIAYCVPVPSENKALSFPHFHSSNHLSRDHHWH
jgi:aspartate/methionine/tyrosine aminotransferase